MVLNRWVLMSALQGVRVLERGSSIAAAFCTKLLAQMGAAVTVSALGGAESADQSTEDGRGRAQAEALYLGVGKEIIGGDDDRAAAHFRAELARTDILVRGVLPHEARNARSLRAEFDECRKVRPELIYVALTPFGVSGELADWVGDDLHAQAMSGWMAANGNPGEAPLSVGYGVGAMQHGLHGAGAALAVLVNNDHVNGEFIDISETLVLASTIRNYALVYRWNQIPVIRSGTRAPGSSGRYPHALFPCLDGSVTVMVRSLVEWQRFLEMIGNPPWADDERYRDFRAMAIDYPEELDALVAPWFAGRTKSELADLALQKGVAMAPLQTIEDALRDQQFGFRSFFESVTVDGVDIRLPGLAAHIH
jgi:CoA:oxalate CoA-transferase